MTPQDMGALVAKLARGYFGSARELFDDLTAASGIKFTHGDRMTTDEAQALIKWGQSTPEVVAIMRDRHHPDHARFVDYQQMIYEFAHDYPAGADGAPAALEGVSIAAVPRVDTMLAMFRKMTPEQAAAHLAWAREQPEFAAYHDARHPQHGQYREQVAMLEEIARGVPVEKSAFNLPAGVAIGRLQGRGDEFGAGDPEAAAAQARLQDAYRLVNDSAAAPAPGPQAPPATPGVPAPTAETVAQRDARIARLHGDARRDRQHAEHAAWKEEIEGAYRAQYPDPAPVADLPGERQQSRPNVIQGPGPIAPSPAPASAPASPAAPGPSK